MLSAMQREFEATGDEKYKCPVEEAILSIDALGFRRNSGALATLLKDQGRILSASPLLLLQNLGELTSPSSPSCKALRTTSSSDRPN